MRTCVCVCLIVARAIINFFKATRLAGQKQYYLKLINLKILFFHAITPVISEYSIHSAMVMSYYAMEYH